MYFAFKNVPKVKNFMYDIYCVVICISLLYILYIVYSMVIIYEKKKGIFIHIYVYIHLIVFSGKHLIVGECYFLIK